MRQSTIFIVLSILFLSVLVAPMPSHKRLNVDPHRGKGTWNNVTESACGNGENDAMVSLSSAMYGTGDYCGRWVKITSIANGAGHDNTAYGQIGGICSNCHDSDLVMTAHLFAELADLATGTINISWNFMQTPPSPICTINSKIACD